MNAGRRVADAGNEPVHARNGVEYAGNGRQDAGNGPVANPIRAVSPKLNPRASLTPSQSTAHPSRHEQAQRDAALIERFANLDTTASSMLADLLDQPLSPAQAFAAGVIYGKIAILRQELLDVIDFKPGGRPKGSGNGPGSGVSVTMADIDQGRQAGLTLDGIAAALGCSTRTLDNILASNRQTH